MTATKTKGTKTQRQIERSMKQLRHAIDSSNDPCVMRIAQAMETALQWSTEETVGWPTMASEAKSLAKILKDELARTPAEGTRE